MNSTLSPGESSRSVNFVKPTFKRTMKNLYGKKGESSGGSGGKQKSGMQKGLKCRRCGLRGHIGENCQVRCHICKRIGHISKNCKQNSIVHNIEQGESSSESYEFGMDENCENALDNELYPEYDHDNECNSVEIEKGNANTCSYLCADFSKLTHLTDSKSSNMYVRDKVFNAFDFSYLVCDPDSTITTDKSDLSLVSDNVFPNVNMIELSKPYVEVEINGKLLSMEFDSGSAVSVVSKRTLLSCGLANLTLTPSRQTLRVANGQIKTVDGCAVVNVELNGEKAHGMQLYVAEDFPSLFGRPWIVKFCGQNWLEKLLSTKLVHNVAPDKSQQVSVSCESCSGSGVDKGDMLTDGATVKNRWKCENTCTRVDQCRSIAQLKQSEVFKSGLGLVKGVQASLVLKDNSKPIMMKARSLPYALRNKVESELNDMVEAKILTKVEDSPWGTPIVPLKKDGGQSVRICGDYKSTLNKCISTRQYPLPTVEECLNAVQGGQTFSKIDIKKAYNNLLIRNEDRVLTTLNTHKGLYQWNRLPDGINSASAIFQSCMDDTLWGVPMTCCRIDDILVSGRNESDHLINLNNVRSRLEQRGFKCKTEKTSFMQKEVVYLGHVVSAEGIKPVKSKVESMLMAPEPRNVDELISFLGAVNYYRRYLPNLSSVIAPIERLRAKNVKWVWTNTEKTAFKILKNLLASNRVLTFYNPKLPLKLDTDASIGGIGAVLSHIMLNGDERPIEFISRTLSPAERNYAQVDKEALAIVWAIKRLHIYLYMRQFTLVTDHRALVRIFGDKPIPEMTAGRLTRWALFLMNYQYDIQYRNTKDHANADMLSRLPKSVTHPVRERDEFGDMFALTMSETLLNAELVANDTRKDPILSRVLEYTLNGWPKNLKCDGDLKAFWTRRDELSHELGCLTWGARVVIPAKLRSTVMDILHATHIGVTGIPICLVTDNGPQFVSDETEGYLKSCGIKHVTVPTYSPKSNGICERLVQSFKSALKKMSVTSKDVCKNLNDFLLTYRNTPHSSTGQTPAVLAFNRTLRSKLHQIKPTDRMREQELQSEKLQVAINEHPRTREFRENQLIFAKMDDKSHWEQARVIKRLGDNSNNYVVQHADAIKPQKTLLTREIARSDIKFQKLHETRERRRMNALNLGVPNGNRLEAVAKPASPVKDTSPAKVTERPQPKVASPLKTNDKQVRVSELSKPTATGGAPLPEPRLGPTRSAKSDAITKMKTMS
ncbi:uncharacterized protein LOC134823403 isoform X1 [Bolinopsis microptera]|uniref:uncharacterized protein LOC134823403 isoform X1 n=1 Tax=Bolinopsis microptera TaxID=2820187 RepID=UPI00307B0310